MLYLVYFYCKRKSGIKEHIEESKGETIKISGRHLMMSILMISIPISLGSIITAINRVIDTATISRGIEVAFASLIPAHGNVGDIINPTAEQLNQEIARLSGLLSKSDTLYNMPLAVNFAFATVLVPSIAGALAVKDYKEASSKINYSLLISILIILPCAIGLITLAEPIYKILYFSTSSGFELLQLVSVSLIFAALAQTMTGSLQGAWKSLCSCNQLVVWMYSENCIKYCTYKNTVNQYLRCGNKLYCLSVHIMCNMLCCSCKELQT